MNSTKVDAKAIGINPYTRICYICGRQFGTKSIGIHEKNCIDKWKATQAALPKTQRLPVPKRPEGWDKEGIHPQAVQNMNEAAFSSYLDQARKNCPNCGRGFVGDRLEVHLRSCTPDGYFAKKAKKKSLSNSSLQDTSSSIKKLETTSSTKATSVKPYILNTVSSKVQKPPELPKPANTAPIGKGLAKFCTSCGVGFPTAEAKFCGSCGEKRVQLA